MSARRWVSILFVLVTAALVTGARVEGSQADALARFSRPDPGRIDQAWYLDPTVEGPATGEGYAFSSRTSPASTASTTPLPALTWQVETVDSGAFPEGLGQHASLAVDSSGHPHVAYYDAHQQDLKYAAFDGSSWISETVVSTGDVGQYASLALDSGGRPHISYYDASGPALKVASFDGGSWQIELVDDDGDVGQYASLALDAGDSFHISYYDATATALKYVFFNESTRSEQTVDSTGNTGLYTSLALRSDGQPCITYIRDGAQVKYACRVDKLWAIDSVYESSRSPVFFTSLAMGAGDTPHVGFHVGASPLAQRYALVYATREGLSWESEPVDNVGVVGRYPSLALDPLGQPHISYYGDGSLKCAYAVSGLWYTQVVDNDGDVGQYTSLALDDLGQPHIAYYDVDNGGLKHASDVPLRFQHIAAQLVAEMRGTGMAPGWDAAQLGSGVRPMYRPDVEGVAYYEFPVAPAGFVIVSTGDHDFPIPHWDYASSRPSSALEEVAAGQHLDAARFYKLDTLSYAAEDDDGELSAQLGALPLKVTGLEPGFDGPSTSFETIWSPGAQADADGDAGGISPTLFISGTVTPPSSLVRTPWASWAELKDGFGETYRPHLEALRRAAAEAWEIEELAGGGGTLRKGDTRLLAALWQSPTVSLVGEAYERGFVGSQQVSVGSDLPPNVQITALDSVLGESVPFTVTIGYPNGATEVFAFQIVEPHEIWLPLVLRSDSRLIPPGGRSSPLVFPSNNLGPQAVAGWTGWSHVWAGGESEPQHGEQCWYNQIESGEYPNDSSCWSGCGATAWAMLFGWADRQAAEGNPYWQGRWGLYRRDGGYGADVVAPTTMTTGVKSMIWEIRNDIDTWCNAVNDNGATWASDMKEAEAYLDGRSYVRLLTWGNNWSWHKAKYRRKAKAAIKYRGPAVIGIGLWEHYPLAYGFKKREYRSPGVTWYTQRKFYVNKGWGESSSRGWVAAFPIWFAGEIRPNVPVDTNEVDDVALHRASDHKWYYDFGHDGDTDALSGAWGKQAGDVALAGDFDADGFVDDTAIFRLDGGNGSWHYNYDHDGDTDEQSGPWAWSGDRPLTGDFDGDGRWDDVAVYRPSTHMWYYDYNHDGGTSDAVSGPWGWADDLPFAGDFDRDGRVDDVALFRPSTGEVYYDYDHDGTTDEVVAHWTTETALPVAGDFDRDGYVDDVAFFIPDWEPVSLWVFDHDHNGPPDHVSEWGWEDGVPVVGAFGENEDPE